MSEHDTQLHDDGPDECDGCRIASLEQAVHDQHHVLVSLTQQVRALTAFASTHADLHAEAAWSESIEVLTDDVARLQAPARDS